MPRGSQPGERRGGRIKGTPNKATADIREIAGQYSREAVEALIKVVRNTESDQARVSAANAILDRAHGKPAQAVKLGGDEDGAPIEQVIRWAQTASEARQDPSAKS